jgi:hypothetical protein
MMTKKILVLSLPIAFIFIVACIVFSCPSGIFTDKPFVEINEEKIFVELAITKEAQEIGLAGHKRLDKNEGMLFVFPKKDFYGFWMKGMGFPIDIIWINDDKVVWIEHAVSPQAGLTDGELSVYYPPELADNVLEINAGESERMNLKEGDGVRVER